MVDEEPPVYRPRRALPADPPNDEPTVALNDQEPTVAVSDQEPTVALNDQEPTIAVSDRGPARPGPGVIPDEDAPKPLYRDEAPSRLTSPGTAGRAGDETTVRPAAGPSPRRSAASPASAGDETQILSRARLRAQASASAAPQRSRPTERGRSAERGRPAERGRASERGGRRGPADADATTMLPRTAAGSRISRRPDVIDDDIDDEPPGRSRLALMVGVVAAVVVIGLALGYLIINLTKPTAAPGTTSPPPGPSASSTGTGSTTASPEAPAAAILSDASMVTADAAKTLDSKRTWKVALTQKGLTADSAQPACLGEPADGQPTAQQTVLRLISSSGTDAPGLLHEALAYTSPEEAAQAYALMAKSIGGCAMTGAYITQGRTVSGLGDQAVGVVVNVTSGSTTTFRSLVLARTGRVIDILDVARPDNDVSFNKAVGVLGTALGTQCAAAGGSCVKDATSKVAPPPIGGDEPGFLTVGDLPPVGAANQVWVGVTPTKPEVGNNYSNCEKTDFATVAADQRVKRTYLLDQDSSRFGLDEIVITAKSDKAAGDLADKIKSDWDSCATDRLTVTVPTPAKISGVGAKSAEITGWTTTVSQKTGTGTTKYRVGVVSVGDKLVFTFLNVKPNLDLSDAEFKLVTVRAGQRATQI